MSDKISLIIPAKNEHESLPKVLNELKDYDLNIMIVLREEDLETINSIKEYFNSWIDLNISFFFKFC